MEVAVKNAPSMHLARAVGKAVVNSPLFKTAVAGNDPNVGRLVGAVGSYLGREAPELDLSRATMWLGGVLIFEGGQFALDAGKEDLMHEHMKSALLTDAQGNSLPYPPHERNVQIEINLAAGEASATVFGSDLTKEYVAINADYRS